MEPLLLDEGLEGALLDLDVGPVAHGGHCVARMAHGRVVFVRHALPGERVRAVVTEERRGYLRADAVEILTASPDRVAPPCPWAGPDRCGGCDFQHASPSAQLSLKAAVVREQLVRLGGLSLSDVDLLQVSVRSLGDPLEWRTRIRYSVDSDGRPGLLKHRSHEVVPVDWCRIAHPGVRSAGVLGRSWPDLDAVEVVAPSSGEVSMTGTRGRASVLLSGPSRVHEHAVGREWSVPASSFWQVHPAAADTLAGAVVRLLTPRPGERAWDLYGGVGLFAAAVAPHLDATGRITVVEADPSAAAAAERNLRDLTTVTVLRSDVDRALANPRWRSVDLVVLDPPRSGAGADVVRAIAAREPRAVAYVACDPAALARDVRTFSEHGYRLAALEAYDLFPMSHHVECVALMTPVADSDRR
jgi:tRNA/tmRNA/rRNA uracil-C5-methylase (TrmA/RlmC/RlmD family)